MATLNSAYQAKKQCNFDSGWSEQQQGSFHSFFWILWPYIQEQQTNQLPCYNQNMNFVNKMEKNVAKYLYPNEKMVVLVWMIDVLIQVREYCVVLTKIKVMSLSFF